MNDQQPEVFGIGKVSPEAIGLKSDMLILLKGVFNITDPVLKYLDTSKSVPEIAAEMFLTPNTVRSHIKNIYQKLNVHNRISSVNKARELGLIK